MVVNAPDSPVQAEVIFVIESTAANGAYINELKTNYIVPTLEYFHGGALEEGGGSGSVYSIVAYRSADCHPGLPVSTYGPFTCPQNVMETVDKIQYIGGHAENRACVTEALATALACFDELGRTDIPLHVLLLCCSPPYSAYAGGMVPPGAPATVEVAARQLASRGALVSVASARRVPALHALFEHAGGELHQALQRNYAKDPRHLVLLSGYSLKERPPSPAPPPIPDIQPDVYGSQAIGRGGPVAVSRPAAPPFPRGPPPRGPNWLAPPRQPLYANNSALLTQLAQPSYPPPPPAHAAQAGHQRMSSMVSPGPSGAAPQANPGAVPGTSGQQPLQRSYIWSGVIEWMEKGKSPGDQQKTTKHLPCQVSASTKDIEPELKVDTWPNKLLMQLMPKQLISNIGGQYLKDSKSVLFHLQPSEALDALTKVMVNGFAGCVHFSPMSSPPQCDIKVLILLYTPDKKAYLGFIPNNQATFVDRLRKVIQQQKMTQIMNKQIPTAVSGAPGMGGNMPTATMSGGGTMGGGGVGGVGGVGVGGVGGGMPGAGGPGAGPSQPMVQPQMQQHQQEDGSAMRRQPVLSLPWVNKSARRNIHIRNYAVVRHKEVQKQFVLTEKGFWDYFSQGMMIAGNMGGQVPQGGKGPRSVTQLDGLEAARQQNLEKIQHLQQTLEAAHQQEAQFKSQMDIMSHLQAAQQQEQHYKQLEEQQRKHQLQQQLQQLRGAGAVGHAPRIMRPLLPSNPGLRHLLQQQPQYRPGAAARPSSQAQQFDDVNNFGEYLS